MTISNSRNKYPWIDTIKSIGVYLVVLGHLWYLSDIEIINRMIYSFHMPLFFIFSGYLYKYKEEEKIPFIKRKFVRLALPAIIWYLITSPIYLYLNRDLNIAEIIRTMLFVDGKIPFNDPCWFFIDLFFVFMFVRLIRIQNTTTIKNLIVGIAAFVLGFFLYQLKVPDYFGMIKATIGLGFFMVGYICHNVISEKFVVKKEHYIIIGLVSLPLWILFGVVLNEKVSLYSLSIGNYWYFILSGIFGTAILYVIVKYIYIYIY